MAPDHFWLDVTGAGLTPALLRHVLRGHHVAVLDVTDAITVFTVSGPAAPTVLEGGTGIDLHPRAFCAGRAAVTRFAALPVLLTRRSDALSFEIFTERAAEEYMSKWLSEAKRAGPF
jgi:sarcosine oxidase subunit gamma